MAGINQIDYDTRGFDILVAAYPMASGAVFSKGEFLIWNGTGLAPVTAGTNYAPTSNSTRIGGKALHDSSYITPGQVGTTTPFTYVRIEVARPGTLFPIVIYNATPASAVPLLAQLSLPYELRRSTAVNGVSAPQIDTGSNTNPAVRVVDFVPSKETIDIPNWPVNVTGGAQYSLAFVEFIGAACAFTGAR